MLLLKWSLCAAMLSQLALCPRLWIADRSFPTVPVFEGLPDLPQIATVAASVLFVLSVLLAAAASKPRPLLFAALAIGAALVLFDINRLQPWFYQLMLLFAALSLANWSDPESPRSRAALALCGLILAATYFWSGAQKANLAFGTEVFPWLLGPLGERLGRLWPVAPVFEVAIGVLLLAPKTRPWGLAGVVVLHVLLLLLLGPLGLNYNAVVWPWNFWMPVIAAAIFFRNADFGIRDALRPPLGKAIAVLVAAMPALNFIDRWDDYLSASLYSGRAREAFLSFDESSLRKLPEHIATFVPEDSFPIGVDLTEWSMADLGVPPYPEVRVYRAVARKVHEAGVPLSGMTLLIWDRPAADFWDTHVERVPIR